ncbi:hypothetical protein LXL04_015576 [Taraxacum kok-saghyz]
MTSNLRLSCRIKLGSEWGRKAAGVSRGGRETAGKRGRAGENDGTTDVCDDDECTVDASTQGGRLMFDVVVAVALWLIWRFRNNAIFETVKLRKDELFDDICFFSYFWISNRRKKNLSWDRWLLSPYVFFVMLLLIVHYFFYGFLFLYCSESTVNLPRNDSIKACFAYGDSFFDSGNNNYINTLLKANFPPYGKDFIGGKPTGRFTNNRTISDYIVEKLGIKDYLPAYLDPSTQDKDLLTGVCFASAGCGYDDITSKIVNVLTLSDQLEMLKEYIQKLKKIVGEEASNHIISNGVHLVSSSSNDWAISYTALPIRKLQYNVSAYANLLLDKATIFLQELYKLGARKIVIFGTPYIGAFPLAKLASTGSLRLIFGKMFNEEAQAFNNMLKPQINFLQSRLPDSTICYVDYFKISKDIFDNHLQYGFEVVDRSCCGTGLFETSILCNCLSSICHDDSKFVFFDSIHLTDKAYNIVVNRALEEIMECML